VTEVWSVSADGGHAVVTGRAKKPIWKKLNPLWWFFNEGEPLPPEGYLKGQPQWQRVIRWYIRNPFQNFGQFVLGVYDRNYEVYGTAPVKATTWLDVAGQQDRTGLKWSVIRLGWLRLPFVSYTGKKVVWYAGWQWWGFFGFKFNIRDSGVQVA
jgi:hypothetical protein